MLNPERPLYIGAPTCLDIEFAHGGTGYVISDTATRKAIGNTSNIQELYGPEVKKFCCGDRMPAEILRKEGVNLTRAWPMFNGNTPLSLAYGKMQWCQPVITMHHMTPFQISQFWTFEQNWKSSGQERPILWMDVYNHFVHPNLQEERVNWTNSAMDIVFEAGSEDFEKSPEFTIQRNSIQSPNRCKELCDHYDECLSWEHHGKTCSLGRTLSFGKSKLDEEGLQWTSGWHLERISRFKHQMSNCSHGPEWTYTLAEAPQ